MNVNGRWDARHEDGSEHWFSTEKERDLFLATMPSARTNAYKYSTTDGHCENFKVVEDKMEGYYAVNNWTGKAVYMSCRWFPAGAALHDGTTTKEACYLWSVDYMPHKPFVEAFEDFKVKARNIQADEVYAEGQRADEHSRTI